MLLSTCHPDSGIARVLRWPAAERITERFGVLPEREQNQ
jgi:hypothetical protein